MVKFSLYSKTQNFWEYMQNKGGPYMKRTLSMLLVLAMLLSCLPMGVLATETAAFFYKNN